MLRKKLAFGSGLLSLLTLISIMAPVQNLGGVAPIKCPDVYSPPCVGTTGDDSLIGSNKNNIIDGNDGNDNINGQGGDDDVCGSGGNDKINGGEGDDRLIGGGLLCKGSYGPGVDTLTGGPGNDILVHGEAWQDESDGFKDFLDCGPGEDTVFANLTIDRDVVAANCEQINPPG